MAKSIKQKVKIIILILGVLFIISGLAFYAAEKSTSPKYENKIDKLLFDRGNKSPKYVITLPDKKALKATKLEEKKEETEKKNPRAYSGLTNEEIQLRELINNTPNLNKLKDIADNVPLKNIEVDSKLSRIEENMLLPKISGDGQKAWIEYARPRQTIQPNFSRVSIIIKNMGLDRRTTNAVIHKFPSEISISFSPYGNENDKLISEARQQGHETYVDMYLSSKDFLKSDSGPLAMSMTASQEENKRRLKKTVSSKSAIGGVIVNIGVADENNKKRLEELFEEVKEMGLLLIDATGETGVQNVETKELARQKADIVINHDYNRDNIRRQLMNAELLAQDKGFVLIAVEPKPVALIEIYDWINSFSPQYTYEEMKEKNITSIEKPFALVPISEVVVE